MANAVIFLVATTSLQSPKLWVPYNGNLNEGEGEREESSTSQTPIPFIPVGILEGLHYFRVCMTKT